MKNKFDDAADAVGMPDEEDKIRIQKFLLKYEQDHPGEILFHRNMARERLRDPKFATTKLGTYRYLFELPVEIGEWMEQAYPTMFRSKKHLAWFAKNFKELLIAEKY